MKKLIMIFIITAFLYPAKSFAFKGEVRKLITSGTHSLLNLEKNEAHKKFRRLLKIKPKHPASYFYMSFALFITDLNTFEKKEKLNLLKDYIIRGNYYAKKLENPDKFDELYIIGMRALFGFLKFRQGHYATGISVAIELLYRIQALYKKYPNFSDGKIGMGLIHMIVTMIPGTLKKILVMISFKGEHKKAVSYLKDVIKEGIYLNDPARSLLAFYQVFFLKDIKGALKNLHYLKNKYPKNFFYYLNIIYAKYYQKKYKECFKLIVSYKRILADKLKNSKYEWRFRFDFIEARLYFHLKKYKRALKLFQLVIKKRVHKWTRDFYCVYSILYRGMIYDVINKRGLALNSYYLLTRNLEKRFARAKNYAQKFVKKPYIERDPRVYKKNKKRKMTLN